MILNQLLKKLYTKRKSVWLKTNRQTDKQRDKLTETQSERVLKQTERKEEFQIPEKVTADTQKTNIFFKSIFCSSKTQLS